MKSVPRLSQQLLSFDPFPQGRRDGHILWLSNANASLDSYRNGILTVFYHSELLPDVQPGLQCFNIHKVAFATGGFCFYNLHFHAVGSELTSQHIRDILAGCHCAKGCVAVFHNETTLHLTWFDNVSDLYGEILHIVFHFCIFLKNNDCIFFSCVTAFCLFSSVPLPVN